MLKRATFLAGTQAWNTAGNANLSAVGIHWISNEEVLFSRPDGPVGHERVFYRHNIKTGYEEQLTGFTTVCNAFPVGYIDNEEISPDGRWIAYNNGRSDCLLAEIEGRHHYTYPVGNKNSDRRVFWALDGHHWADGYMHPAPSRLILHDTEHPHSSIALPAIDEVQLGGVLEALVSPQEAIFVNDKSPATDAILLDTPHPEKPLILTISRLSLSAPPASIARYQVPVPGGNRVYQMVISPRGDRIAWQTRNVRGNAAQNWLHRYLSFVPYSEKQVTEVWVSNLDGSHTHEIGNIVDASGEESIQLGIQWLPDGKHLGFEYKEALYTVSAD